MNVEGNGVEELAAPGTSGYDHSGEAVFGRTRWLQMREVLTADQWEAIRMHFFEGCTLAEIGKKRNQAVANVRHHFYRGLERLRKCVFQDELRGC
jgi:RNA polymerase sigma-70 factor (ECF subfamily)